MLISQCDTFMLTWNTTDSSFLFRTENLFGESTEPSLLTYLYVQEKCLQRPSNGSLHQSTLQPSFAVRNLTYSTC